MFRAQWAYFMVGAPDATNSRFLVSLSNEPQSFFQMSHSLSSRMWFSATTLRTTLMIQTAATLKAVSLTITLSHETIPRGLLGIKMRVSWSLSAKMSPAYHSSLVEDTVSKAIGLLRVHGRRSCGE